MLQALQEWTHFGNYMYLVWLLIGFAVLIKGADLLVDSAAKLAELFGVSAFIIGLSVVAFGTSAPETAVGLFSAISKTNQLSLGNVVGACIANIALIIGITAMIAPLQVNKPIVKKEIPMSFFVQLLLCILVIIGNSLGLIDGVILLILFAGFIYYIAVSSKKQNESMIILEEVEASREQVAAAADSPNKKRKKIVRLVLMFFIGLAGLIIGGDLVVDNATSIARMYNVNETIIGLTIISIGTTLPEMVATLTATFRKQSDIAVGNILGSNIFNVLCVLGVSASTYPIRGFKLFGGADALIFDIGVMLLTTILLFTVTSIYHKVPRWMGFVFLICYGAYILFKIAVVV